MEGRYPLRQPGSCFCADGAKLNRPHTSVDPFLAYPRMLMAVGTCNQSPLSATATAKLGILRADRGQLHERHGASRARTPETKKGRSGACGRLVGRVRA